MGATSLELSDYRNHFTADAFDRRDLVHGVDVDDEMLDTDSGQRATSGDQVGGRGGAGNVVQGSAFDLVIRPAHRLTVSLQHVELVGDLGPADTGEQVAGVAVLGHQTQRLLFAPAADRIGGWGRESGGGLLMGSVRW